MNKVIAILILAGLLLPSFSFAQEQVPPIKAPETIEEVKEMGEKALEVGEKELPGIIERIWKEEVLPIWQKMYDWFKTNIWPKIQGWFKKEVTPEIEKRKPLIKEEFQKEKKEMKESAKTELPKVSKSLWEKFKELIK
jgi:hypothetical protein